MTTGASTKLRCHVSLLNAFRDVFREEDEGDTERDREDDPFSFFNPGSSSRHHPQHGNNAEDDPTLTISFPVMEDDDGEDIIDLKTPLPYVTVLRVYFPWPLV